MTEVSPRRRREVIDALRRGTVPSQGLDLLAVGLEPFDAALNDELTLTAGGGSVFKAVRGEYGSGKTFFSRHLAERAMRSGFATAEVQISETETPLHRLETIYRRITESLRTASVPPSAFRSVLDSWLFTLDDEAADSNATSVDQIVNQRLAAVSRTMPAFAQVLRGYRSAVQDDDQPRADALVAWLGGQPHVAAAAKRSVGVKGDLDHFGAMGALQGLLIVLRDAGHPGLLVVLDEVETLQRMRGDVRDKALNALRQLIDEIDSGRFPGLYLLITGTPAFFEGPSGVSRLPPLSQRLQVDFGTDRRFDNPRAVQIRLHGFDRTTLIELGARVRDLFADGSSHPDRIRNVVDDRYVGELADAVAGSLGGNIGVAPRVYLRKLVGDVLDRVDQFEDFDPRQHYQLTIAESELTDVERNLAHGATRADDIKLDL